MPQFTNISVFTKTINDFLEQKRVQIISEQKSQKRRASGRSAAGLKVDVKSGYGLLIDTSGYLDWGSESGRRPGKLPPIAAILEWTKIKGIRPQGKSTQVGLAIGIAKKIAREGTLLFRRGGKSGVISGPLSTADISKLRDELGGIAETYVRTQVKIMVEK